MNVEIKDINQCVKEITITIPSDKALNDYRQVLGKFKNLVVVPGFRKGKAPISMVDNLFHQQARDAYLKDKAYEYLEEAFTDKKIEPLFEAMPLSLDWEKGKDLVMVFRYEIKPTVVVNNYTGLEIPYRKIEFTEKLIEDVFNKMIAEASKLERIEGPAEKGDFVSIRILTIDKIEENQEKMNSLSEKTDEPLELEPEDIVEVELSNNDYGEKLHTALLGAKTGDVIETAILLADDPHEYSAKISVDDIQRKTAPVLDDEFAKAHDYESIAAMREDIEKNMRKKVEENNEWNMKQSLMEKLIEENPFDIPPSSILFFAQKLAEPYARLLNKKPEDVAEHYTGKAYQEIMSYYIIEELLKKVSLEIEERDEKETIEELAARVGMTTEEYLDKNSDVTKGEDFVKMVKERKLYRYLTDNNTFVIKEDKPEDEKASDEIENAEQTPGE